MLVRQMATHSHIHAHHCAACTIYAATAAGLLCALLVCLSCFRCGGVYVYVYVFYTVYIYVVYYI